MQAQFRSACLQGDLDAITAILRSGTSIDLYGTVPFGNSVLGIVCMFSRTAVFELLMREFPDLDLNRAVSVYGHTPLAVACAHGKHEIVRILLSRNGVDINKPAHVNCTPLWLAVRTGRLKCVEYLMALGAGPLDISSRGEVISKKFDRFASFNGTVEQVAIIVGNKDISNLLTLYKRDPRTTRSLLRKKLGFPDDRPASLLLTLLLLQ